MAADTGTAAITNKHDLVAGSVCRMRRAAKPLAAFTKGDLALAGVSDLSVLEQSRNRLDQRRFFDRAAVADNLDLKRANDVADEADLIHRPARGDQRRSY